jgi:hypothetical protein
MTNAEHLRQLIRDHQLTRARTAELCDASIHSVHSWLLPPSNKAHRNMPNTKLRLLRLELNAPAK